MAGMFSRARMRCNYLRSNSNMARSIYSNVVKGTKISSQRKLHSNARCLSLLASTVTKSEQKTSRTGHSSSSSYILNGSMTTSPIMGVMGIRFNSSFPGGPTSGDLEALSDGSDAAEPLIDHSVNSVLDLPLESAGDILSLAGEPSLASLGLGGYSPVGLIQSSLELLHVYCGMPWWGAIVAGTITFRVMVLPLMIKGQINGAKLNAIRPELERIQQKMKALANTQNEIAKAHTSMEMQKLLKDNNCHPLKSLITPLVQMPLFISFFLALRRMASLPVESLQTGGLFWFPDLTMHDPMFILPVLTGLSMLATIELGAEAGVTNQKQFQMTKNIFRFMAFAMVPLTAKFPTAVFMYWVTSNAFSIFQVFLLKQSFVKKAVGLPDVIPAPPSDEKSVGFLEGMKAGYKNAKSAAVLRSEEKQKERAYRSQIDGLQEETYDYNPRLKNNEELFKSKNKRSKRQHRN